MVRRISTGIYTLDGLTLIGTNDECAPTGVDGEIADYKEQIEITTTYINEFYSWKRYRIR